MQARLSWFALTSLRAVYRWRGGRELFYKTAAKAVVVDRVVSALALGALLSGAACIAIQPFSIAWPVWGVLILAAPMAWQRRNWRVLLFFLVALGIMATRHTLSLIILGLTILNLSAAILIAIEGRLLRRWTFKPLYLGNTNVGSARLLRGQVNIAHLFLNTSRCWRVGHIRATMKSVACACRWLTKEAQRFGVHVEFTHRRISAMEESWIAEVPSSKNGYASLRDFEQFLDRQLAAVEWPTHELAGDEPHVNHCLMVHVAEWTDERPYAMPAMERRADHQPAVEYVIVSARDTAATFAHELLHLFGADDFYFDGKFDKGWYAGQVGELLDAGRSQFLQRCVMFRTGARLGELAVDDQTAQKIGWL